jgi:hypothetical protein
MAALAQAKGGWRDYELPFARAFEDFQSCGSALGLNFLYVLWGLF